MGWVSCSLFLVQNRSQLTKNYLLWEKSGLSATFDLIFLGLGWPWVVEFVGFIVIFICFPTQQSLVHRRHPYDFWNCYISGNAFLRACRTYNRSPIFSADGTRSASGMHARSRKALWAALRAFQTNWHYKSGATS